MEIENITITSESSLDPQYVYIDANCIKLNKPNDFTIKTKLILLYSSILIIGNDKIERGSSYIHYYPIYTTWKHKDLKSAFYARFKTSGEKENSSVTVKFGNDEKH